MNKQQDFALNVYNDINKIRQNPQSAIKRFQNLKLITSFMKGTKDFIKEINELLNIISDAPGINALRLSPGLTLAAERQIQMFEEDQLFTNFVSEEELKQRCSEYTKGWKKLYQVADDGGDEPQDVINRLVNLVKDVDKISRRIILDNSLNYVGIAHKVINNRNAVVIICADNVEELELKPPVEGFKDYLNSIRVSPAEHVNTFEILSETLKKKKVLSTEAKNVANYLNKIKNQPLCALNSNDLLNDLAQIVLENLPTIKTNDNLKDLASEQFSGFRDLAFYVNTNGTRGEKIVTDMLLDPYGRANFLENPRMTMIGMVHIPRLSNSPAITVVIVADDIKEGGESVAFEERFIGQINMMRKNPANALPYLEDIITKNKKFFSSSKKKFIKELEELVVDFDNYKDSLPDIMLNKGLTLAAEEYLEHLIEARVKKFYPQDEEYLRISLSHYIQGFTLVNQFIQVGGIRTETVITDLLVSENDKERKSRKALLDKRVLFAGVAHGMVGAQRITIVIFTDKADELSPSKFSEELLEQINNIRAHPKSYVKYIQEIIDEARYPKWATQKSLKDTFMQDMAVIKHFLQTTRSFGRFAVDSNLTLAAQTKLNEISVDPPKNLNKYDVDDLNAFLSDFGSQFSNIAQCIDIGADSPRELLIKLITNDTYKFNREAIFSTKLNLIGIARSSEMENEENDDADNKSTVILFADKFEAIAESDPIVSTYDKKHIIKRPAFTPDEIQQMQKDFKLLDVLNTGFIKPEIILLFMQKSFDFADKNPFYYDAIRLLNTDENNANGVDVDEFINAVGKVIASYHEDQRWYEIFSIFINRDRKKIIDFDTLRKVTDEIGYKISNEDLLEVLEKISPKISIDKDKFIETMNLAERNLRNKK